MRFLGLILALLAVSISAHAQSVEDRVAALEARAKGIEDTLQSSQKKASTSSREANDTKAKNYGTTTATQLVEDSSATWNLGFTGAVAISTVVYAILTWQLVSETRRMRQSQTEPKIDVSLRPRDEWINFIDLEIRNIGPGPAYDVSFTITPHINNETHQKILMELNSLHIIKQGIGYLSPRRELRSFLMSMARYNSEMAFTVRVAYKDNLRNEYNDIYVLDFAELTGLKQLGEPPANKIAKSIEEIARDIGHIASGFSRVKVETTTQAELQREREDFVRDASRIFQTPEGPSHAAAESARVLQASKTS